VVFRYQFGLRCGFSRIWRSQIGSFYRCSFKRNPCLQDFSCIPHRHRRKGCFLSRYVSRRRHRLGNPLLRPKFKIPSTN
jgi:hypothetical protein